MNEKKEKRIHLKEEHGMITVEMLLIMTMYIMFFAGLMTLINAMIIQYRIQSAVNETVRELSVGTALKATSDESGQVKDTYETWIELSSPLGEWLERDQEHDDALLKNAALLPSKLDISAVSKLFYSILKSSDPDVRDYLCECGYEGEYRCLTVGYGCSGDIRLRVDYKFRCFRIPFSDGYLLEEPVTVLATSHAW